MIEGRVATVTGGLQGIGLAIAVEFARHGARVAVGARRGDDAELVEGARDAIGKDSFIAPLDVRSNVAVAAFMRDAEAAIGPPEILVNAAGIFLHQMVEGHSDEDWEATIDTNLSGPFRMIRACLPAMKARGWGRIVNIASTAARSASADHPAYCASKAGLVGLTRAVALEGAPYGITCVAISPTWVETDMMRASVRSIAERSGRSVEEELADIRSASAQRRVVQPQEVAALALFCCSDAAAGLTMEDIQVNAGAIW